MNRLPLSPWEMHDALLEVGEAVAHRLRDYPTGQMYFERVCRAQRLLLHWWKRGIELETRRVLFDRLIDEERRRD